MDFMPIFIFVILVLYYGMMEVTQPQCVWNGTRPEISEEIDLNRNPILYDEERVWRKEMAMISWILGMPYNAMQKIEYILNNITAPRNLDGDTIMIEKFNETLANYYVTTILNGRLLNDSSIVINDTNHTGNFTLSTEIYNYLDYRILSNETIIAMG
ncbi:uncharacterized protein LOC6524550 [Drosophila yakuba]|uniref:Uncharacterized protein n=1 Tax=Drosophila yakuba TaxID=7245 RepID=B4Q1Z4_DROYA|nr:uncharacterized protein LOC6524550 [Drosophila yakuba]EDX01515.2 uncharacterized protein Dyak_GE16187 [Drosophila yakuba]